MDLDDTDRCVLAMIEGGLPLSAQPYADVAAAVGVNETDVLDRLGAMLDSGIVKRLGVIVRHRSLGYTANAMCVWDVPDPLLPAVGSALADIDFVTLCYARPRRLPAWPYNLFCMIHGAERAKVETQIKSLDALCRMDRFRGEIMFSRRCFKQRGARYSPTDTGGVAKVA